MHKIYKCAIGEETQRGNCNALQTAAMKDVLPPVLTHANPRSHLTGERFVAHDFAHERLILQNDCLSLSWSYERVRKL